jgi:DNA polymerase phi
LESDQADISDVNGLDDRRRWAIDQMVALCRNASVPKDDEWVTSVVDFLAVHGFYTIRKANKKSNISAVSQFPAVLT